MTDLNNKINGEKLLKPEYKEVDIKEFKEVEQHKHNGRDANRIDPNDLKMRFYEVVSSAPTDAPNNFVDQIKIYGDLLYVWDNTNETWKIFNNYTP